MQQQFPFDAVVLATSYLPAFDTFLKDVAAPTPDVLSTAHGLYFCGFHNSITGLLREISLEAPRIAAGIAKGT